MIKKVKILLIFPLLFLSLSIAKAEEWQELKSEHFIAYFTRDEKFVKEVLDKAEVYYRSIALDLGYSRYKEFWTWDKRVKIYIYPDHASYLKATGQPDWSQGVADYRAKQIISFIWSRGFLESLLPHEMAHLIFRDFVGFESDIPLWLDEGVAQWAEDVKRGTMKRMVKDAYNQNGLLSMNDMMKLEIRNLKDKNLVFIRPTRTKEGNDGVVILNSTNLVNLYYLEAASLVDFLIAKYGSDSFANLCRQLRDGKQIEEALTFTYPSSIRSIGDLDNQWRDYIARQY
jgi:hypothetical protein